jgi:hypothetical protein
MRTWPESVRSVWVSSSVVSYFWRKGGMPSCVWFARLEVLVLFVKVIVSGGGFCPLSFMHVLFASGG